MIESVIEGFSNNLNLLEFLVFFCRGLRTIQIIGNRELYFQVLLSWAFIKAGVPQGSILGTLLFLIYTNDIGDDIHSCIRLFTDDTSLYIIVDNPISTADELNADLSKSTFLDRQMACII